MYPELFTIPYVDYPISTFGVMMAAGFLAAFWIGARRFREEGLDPEAASTILMYTMVGGVLGSKLYFAVDNWIQGNGPFAVLFFARAGITWYGGLIGGLLAGVIGCRIHKLPTLTVANCVAVALPVGQALGRVGCFLVGDDYGVVTDLPWGVTFPRGAPPTIEPVHPTQIYEILWLLPVAMFLWRRRHRSPFLFGEYLVLNGAGRVVIESWRVNPEVALGLTEPQWIGFALVVLGTAGWVYDARRRRPVAPPSDAKPE